jgi:hypoxanthine phosphoribosyltransferase
MNAFLPREVRPLISAERIAERVAELAAQITREYAGRSLVLLSVLKGSFVFAADLARAIALPVRVEFLGVRSYGADTKSSGVVQITQDLTRPVEGDDILIVEDIVDTGLTLSYLRDQLHSRSPASVKVAALLHKPARMQREVEIDYLGFTIEDVFVVGYGLDFAERYRNLPFLGVLDPSLAKSG